MAELGFFLKKKINIESLIQLDKFYLIFNQLWQLCMWHCLSFTFKLNSDSGFKHSWSVVYYNQEDVIVTIILHLRLIHNFVGARILEVL